MVQSRSVETSLTQLTARQREVASLIAARFSQKEIAFELGISETSVQRHVTAIKQRLGVNSLREIASILTEEGRIGGWEKPTGAKADVAPAPPFWPKLTADEPHVLKEREPEAMNFMPSMPVPEEPRIVPRLLDGKYRVPLRLAVIAGMIISSIAAIILIVAAMQSVSELVREYFP